MPRILTILAVFLLCTVCYSGCAQPNAAFVKSMDSTYQAVAPEYEAYVRSDSKINADDKQIRLNTLKQWRATLDEAMKHAQP
jgi:hypothetical protein